MTNTNSSSNNTAINPITSAKFFRYNVLNNTIEGSELNFKKAGNPTSAQFAELMEFKALQPSFTLAPIAPKVKKQTYAGLNFDLMMDYVEYIGNDIQKAEFQAIVDNNEKYPTIKSWFIDNFKAGFTVEKAKREIEAAKKKIAQEKLKERKAKVRATVKATVKKAAPVMAETPSVINF